MSLHRPSCLILFCMLVGLSGANRSQAQASGCTVNKQVYTCDRASFQQALTAAKTVRVEAAPQDRVAAAKLRDLVAGLGKAVTGPQDAADLTFSLLAVNTDGVLVGPAGVELAILRVYGHAGAAEKGDLVWAETFRGQPDMSWPATAQATIQQFRAGFKR